MTATRRAFSLLRAAAAVMVILGLAAGVPLLLIQMFGNPVPERWTWSAPLTNDAILGLLASVAWIFWAQVVVCLVVEITAEIRLATGRSADWLSRVPGTLGGQQTLARVLVEAVIAVGITSTAAVVVAGPLAARAESLDAVPQPSTVHPPAVAAPQSAAEFDLADPRPVATTTVEVQKGDSLWSIAEQLLGSGERWRAIAELNQGHLMPDGQQFADARAIQPGWTLLIPDTDLSQLRGEVVTVAPGDTLLEIANDAYGDGDAWPRIYQANRSRIGDPDLIYPGQHLRVPGTTRNDLPGQPDGKQVEEPPEVRQQTPSERGARMASPPTRVPTTEPNADPDPETSSDTSTESGDDVEHDAGSLARTLSGGGALLAGSLLIAFVARRRAQFRVRRSGRTIPGTRPDLVPVESAVRSAGSAGGAAVQFLDLALRDLACRTPQLPEVAAARLSNDFLELVLSAPHGHAPEGWTASPDGLRWRLHREANLAVSSSLAPYPTLVAMGVDRDGGTWLVDLEAVGIVQLDGPKHVCADLARFITAELATNRWSDDVEVLVAGMGAELVPLNPNRLEPIEGAGVDRLINRARRIAEIGRVTGHDVLAGRRDGTGGDSWMPTVVVADTSSAKNPSALAELADTLAGERLAAALVAFGKEPVPNGIVVAIDDAGRASLPWVEEITVNRLTEADAGALGTAFASAEQLDDEPMPTADGGFPGGEDQSDALADAAGALRTELTDPRDSSGSIGSLLPEADACYLMAAATTVEDMTSLAPDGPPEALAIALATDPSLDDDVADWFGEKLRRPQLRLLGPVELRVDGERPQDVRRRVAYFAEIATYLFCHPQGATAPQLANHFGIQANTLHSRMLSLRKWLGDDPETGTWHVPEATMSLPGTVRGVGNYEITGLLCDADLFRRLRTRGQARGAEGMEDLVTALRLVGGAPFDQLRSGGYGWLAETATDHHLTAGIVDVAHLVATAALASGDPERAAWAAEQAIRAAPYEDKPRLDLARAQIAMGHVEDGRAYVAAEVFNRSDDDQAPPDPSPRVSEVARRLVDVRGAGDVAEHLESET